MRIGDINARCPKCGATRFLDAGGRAQSFTCLSCGTKTPRAALVDQIARDAIERADKVLKARRKPP